MLLFGSGGVMVEVYNDVALRRCPITRSEAQAMIAEVKEPGCSGAFAGGRRRTSRRGFGFADILPAFLDPNRRVERDGCGGLGAARSQACRTVTG